MFTLGVSVSPLITLSKSQKISNRRGFLAHVLGTHHDPVVLNSNGLKISATVWHSGRFCSTVGNHNHSETLKTIVMKRVLRADSSKSTLAKLPLFDFNNHVPADVCY